MDEQFCGRQVPHDPHGYTAPIDSQAEHAGAPTFLECGGFPSPGEVLGPEAVDHPAHYGDADDPYETIKVIRAWGLGFNLGNTVKYISRAGKKDPTKLLEDLEKALWYLADEVRQIKENQ